jgi:hypothetical protein
VAEIRRLRTVPSEAALAVDAGVLKRAEAVRGGGWYFSVLKWAFENGLSFETCGRKWVLVTPRSASKKATGLKVIAEPRSV